MDEYLLNIQNLETSFFTSVGVTKAANGVNWNLRSGETLGVVGESGSGKSVTALSILRLIPDPPGKIVAGRIFFQGVDLLSIPLSKMRTIRGNSISMIFQEPMTSLNPVFTVGNQIAEAISLHQGLSKQDSRDKCIEILRLVGIPSPDRRIRDYPYQMSGGMRQRVMIAMALSCNPQILIADEPTTALDVTIQAQILDLMNRLKEEMGTAIVMITHNLGVVAEMAQRVIVMYAGTVVEEAPVDELFYSPRHPYTKGLLKTVPRLDDGTGICKRLPEIPGMIPNLYEIPEGCSFHPRCQFAIDECRHRVPPNIRIGEGHSCRCWLAEKGSVL